MWARTSRAQSSSRRTPKSSRSRRVATDRGCGTGRDHPEADDGEAVAVDDEALDDPGLEEEPEGFEITTDSLQLFLKDVGKVDLLTAAQEVELAKRIERGDHRAKQEMVEANLRLVVSIAKRLPEPGAACSST